MGFHGVNLYIESVTGEGTSVTLTILPERVAKFGEPRKAVDSAVTDSA